MRTNPILLAALAVLAGCATYDPNYEFDPAPAVATIVPPDGGGGRLLATVLGVRNAHDDEPPAIDVRVRVERSGETPLSLDVGAMSLVTADMTALRPADPPGTTLAAADAAAVRDVAFPLPAGRDADDLGLSGLSLLAPVTVGARRIEISIPFRRVEYVWPDPWWGPGWGFGGYWGHHHHSHSHRW
jgi:hypothetical protein